jgi:hypothetical protein
MASSTRPLSGGTWAYLQISDETQLLLLSRDLQEEYNSAGQSNVFEDSKYKGVQFECDVRGMYGVNSVSLLLTKTQNLLRGKNRVMAMGATNTMYVQRCQQHIEWSLWSKNYKRIPRASRVLSSVPPIQVVRSDVT